MTTIRRATVRDRAVIEGVVRRCGKHVRDYFGIRNLIDFYKRGNVWLVEAPLPSAFAVAKPLVREPVISLYEIGVIPEARGRGIAGELLRAINQQPEYTDRTWRLVVNEDNEHARRVYEHLGLAVVSHDFTKGGRPIIRMEGRIK